MKKLNICLVCLVAVLLIFSVGCQQAESPGDGTKLTKVSVILDWVPNTNHTGLYAAKDLGFYAEEGLDVEILQPTVGGTASLIAAGQGDFGVSYQEEVVIARSQELPVTSIAAVIQHNTSGFASHRDKNIQTPRDFAGKKYGGWGSPAETQMIAALMEKYGVDPKTVEEINIGEADFFTSIQRDIDFAWIYYGWTGIEAELRGIPLNIIMLNDEEPALDFYTPVLIAREDTLENKSDLVKKFLRATARGYELASKEPEKAAKILLANAPELDASLVKASQEWLAPRYQDDAPYWGYQDTGVWQDYSNWMYERGLLEENIDPAAAFTNDFLPGA
ncbi:MAG TPA: ABC transporter substrate-binding protein [Clostridia bacterium]|nr:ABC transporter substrate-binding protein [Clostridia bacterium]